MMKEKMLEQFKMSLYGSYDVSAINDIANRLSVIMNNYNVTSASDQLVVYEDYNSDIKKQYAVCMALAGKSKKTIQQYIHQLERFDEFCHKDYRMVTTQDIRAFIADVILKGKSKRYAENIRMYLSSFFRFLEKEKQISENPVKNIDAVKYGKTIEESFSDVEIDRIKFANLNLRDRAIIEVLLSSGVRVSELCALNRDDVDLQTKKIHVRHGKGDKPRITYISDVACFHLQKYLDSRLDLNEAMFLNRPKRKAEFQKRIADSGVRYVLKQLGEATQIDNVHPHRFRHTFATNLYRKGMDVHKIQLLLGHNDISTTMQYISQNDAGVEQSYRQHII